MGAKAPSVEVVGTGFTVLDRIYQDGNLSEEALGGSCGNVLVSLAMLNRAVAPILSLGQDEIGQRLVREFFEAGADVRFIHLRQGRRSPVVLQELDTAWGVHRFSFTCAETLADLPRYEPIRDQDVDQARGALSQCSVFYADRLSEAILEAMTAARTAGAIVYFEPSVIERNDLFDRALSLATILKYSSDRLGNDLDEFLSGSSAIGIATQGADGLELRQGARRIWCEAVRAPQVIDTCGSGDMVSVGLIDWLLTQAPLGREPLELGSVLQGVLAGQRLAAANCAYAGARGLFRRAGAGHARRVLEGSTR